MLPGAVTTPADQHDKTMRVEPLRSSTEGVASMQKDGAEVLTEGDKV
jgi:hypothetical protein